MLVFYSFHVCPPHRLIREACDVNFGVRFCKEKKIYAKLLAFLPRVILIDAQLKDAVSSPHSLTWKPHTFENTNLEI